MKKYIKKPKKAIPEIASSIRQAEVHLAQGSLLLQRAAFAVGSEEHSKHLMSMASALRKLVAPLSIISRSTVKEVYP